MNDVDRVTAHYEARDRANAAKLKLLCKQYDDHISTKHDVGSSRPPNASSLLYAVAGQLADELQTARQVAREAQAAEKAVRPLVMSEHGSLTANTCREGNG